MAATVRHSGFVSDSQDTPASGRWMQATQLLMLLMFQPFSLDILYHM